MITFLSMVSRFNVVSPTEISFSSTYTPNAKRYVALMSSRIFRRPFLTAAPGSTGSSPISSRMCWEIISLVMMVTAARVICSAVEISTREIGPCSRTTRRICMRFLRLRSSLLMPQSFMTFFLFFSKHIRPSRFRNNRILASGFSHVPIQRFSYLFILSQIFTNCN